MGEDASKIRQAIEETRSQLGDTLEALAYKTDVPARASEAIVDGIDSAKANVERTIDRVVSTVDEKYGVAYATAREAGQAAQELFVETRRTVVASLKELSAKSDEAAQVGQDRLERIGSATDDRISRAVSATARFARRNPLAALASAAAAGFFVAGAVVDAARDED